ncbi:MAG: alginate O-acetyltransferase AlgF [Cellvibrionaceae bacterium]
MKSRKCKSVSNAKCVAAVRALTCVLASAVSGLTVSAIASEVDERALYELAPENSAFVRLINLTDQKQSLRLNEIELSVDGYCSASSYKPIGAGAYPASLVGGGQQTASVVAENLAYSFVVDQAGVTVFVDKVIESPRKSLLSIYNFTSSDDLSLKTSDGKFSVFSALNRGDYAYREINPIKVSFSVFSLEEKLMDVETTIFERGVVSSLLLCDDSDSLASTWARQ